MSITSLLDGEKRPRDFEERNETGTAEAFGPGGVIIAAALAVILEMATAAALAAPSADEIVRKFLTLRASSPQISVADISVALRTKVPVTQPPTRAYVGKFNSTGARYAITIEREVRSSPICKQAASHRDNLLEVVRQTMEAVVPLPAQAEAALKLDRFDLAVRDQKVVGVGQSSDYFYLLDGKAKDPKNDPRAFHGWIDYDQGLWQEGTITYSWGEVEAKQKYTHGELLGPNLPVSLLQAVRRVARGRLQQLSVCALIVGAPARAR